MNLFYNRILFTVGFLLLGLVFSQAQTFIGTTGNRLWSDCNNWVDGVMPNNAYSSVTVSADVIVDEDVNIGTLHNSGNFSLTVKEGKRLTANSFITWGDTNDFILEDKAQLVCPIPVKVTVKKSIHTYNEDSHVWNLISSPVEDDIVPSIENGFLTEPATGYVLYSYNETSMQWNDFKESPFVIEKGKGYLYANALDTTLVFEGKTAGGVAAYSLSYHAPNGTLAGFNLKGNPLPCNAFVDRSYYIFGKESNHLTAVAFSMNQPVAPCTGLIVQAKDSYDNTVWFECGAIEQPENQGYIEITAAKSNAPALVVDQALVSFNAGDDLAKYIFFENSPLVYFTKDNHDLAIVSLDNTDMQPFKFKAVENGSYTLHFEPKKLSLDYLHLIDNLNGANVDLLASPNYTFDATPNDYASRFKLVFDPNYGVDEHQKHDFAYFANGKIILTETCKDGLLQIVDLTGHVVMSVGNVKADGSSNVSTAGMAPGMYVLRLYTEHTILTQKVIVYY